MMDLSRTEILIGDEKLGKIRNSSVAVFGLGGVGGYAVEAVARAGVSNIIIADYDRVAPSNINRQIFSLRSTMGEMKTDVSSRRLKDINPDIKITVINERLTPSNIMKYIPDTGDLYAIDAIDEIDAKISLIKGLIKKGIPFVSSMGAGSRLDPTKIRISDISKTEYCPLARVIRRKLRDAEITTGVRCIFSTENLNRLGEEMNEYGKRAQGSISFMPGIFGLTAAGVIINDIIGE